MTSRNVDLILASVSAAIAVVASIKRRPYTDEDVG